MCLDKKFNQLFWLFNAVQNKISDPGGNAKYQEFKSFSSNFALVIIYKQVDFNKNIKFKIGSENWEMPLGVLLLLGGIALVLMIGGLYMGFSFGKSQY